MPDADHFTPAALTAALRAGGALDTGEVAAVEQAAAERTLLSRLVPLALRYTPGSTGRRPTALLAKVNEGPFFAAGQREAAFYRTVAAADDGLPLAGCHGITVSASHQHTCLLLDDLRPSHAPPETPWPVPPPPEQCRAAIDALARVHARTWDRAPPVDVPAGVTDWATEWCDRAAAHLPRFLDAAGDGLTAAARALYPRLIDALPARLAARLAEGPVAVQHGDAHFWNALFPRTDDDGGCVLVDWQLWRIGPPAFDLAYMLGLHGEPSWRDAMEIPLLEHYADAMRRRGIAHPWQKTWHDYRLGVIFVLLYPVLLHRMGVTEQVWAPHLRRGWAAFDDLDCAALIG